MKIEFSDLYFLTGACEQFADDLLNFNVNTEDLTIEIIKGQVSPETMKWIEGLKTEKYILEIS